MAKPFLKWVGGKRQLLPIINENLPSLDEINVYIEPFVGGGAVLFDILSKKKFTKVFISDINPELTLCYQILRDENKSLIKEFSSVIRNWPSDDVERKKQYYEHRDFWNQNLSIVKEGSVAQKIKRAALTMFMNRVCFNGLFRVNSKGEFNVPIGSYKNPSFPSDEELVAVGEALQNVEILTGDYTQVIQYVTKRTFVYFDPPYRPLSSSSSFTSYSKSSFNDSNQTELANFYSEISTKGAKLMLSNSDPKNTDIEDDFFDILYSSFRILRLQASRAINSDPSKRGKISEILVLNY
jgi:DNA adenine methylase